MEKLRGLDEEAYVSAIFHNREEAEQFVDKCYTPEAYLRAYSPVIQSVKSMKYWPTVNQTPVLPPIVKKQPGRPEKRKIIKDSEMEKNKDPTKLGKKEGWAYKFQNGSHRGGMRNNEMDSSSGSFGENQTPPTQSSNVQQSCGGFFVAQGDVTGEPSRHCLKNNTRPPKLPVRNNKFVTF
ncbi:hypothetical protein L3X38_037910 [Prunus dulcis]|uniref:Uncharacterized protein n=1 Tax=Prunus dulcis TaxID=3755 RepID=A0AAD4YQ02_PRUDU|nr:hypothetical protein L3X38_037910 [Prunus dulcis]